ncbi:MAG: squalene--hopene cyclase, partial [Gemmataceae bacterium]
LFLESPEAPWQPSKMPPRFSWARFFLTIDKGLKVVERWKFTPLRHTAMRRAIHWMRERFSDSDGLGAIYPPMIYTVVVLKCFGIADDAPEMRWARRQLDSLLIDDGESIRIQPCLSPVWDTALSLVALAGQSDRTDIPRALAIEWLLNKQVSATGDWSDRVPGVPPAGWFFEYRNTHYPDTDDTSMALMALARNSRGNDPAAGRAVQWLLAMQNSDGGWAAFDRDINNEVFTQVPFADHNAMLDPSCPDITARILESLSEYGFRLDHPAVARAVDFILGRQETSGSWFGRWGVNYLYGTWQVLVGLAAVGFDMTSPSIRRAVRWLKEVQNSDGGWGETCASYDDPRLAGQGPSTASQTAWALLGLMAAGENPSAEVAAGLRYLLATQQADGTWHETAFTGTGFPRVFYLRYHLYPLYFPIMALARADELTRRPRRALQQPQPHILNRPE